MFSEAKPGLTGKGDDLVGEARPRHCRGRSVRGRTGCRSRWPASALARSDARRLDGAAHRLEAVALARRRGEDEIADRRSPRARVSNTVAAIDHMVGLARRGARLVARPAVARIDEPQLGQAEIGHGARHHADVLAELRLDEDDRRAFDELRSRSAACHCLPSCIAFHCTIRPRTEPCRRIVSPAQPSSGDAIRAALRFEPRRRGDGPLRQKRGSVPWRRSRWQIPSSNSTATR